jgi:hypothetical protein
MIAAGLSVENYVPIVIVKCLSVAYCEIARKLEFLLAGFFDVDIFEGQHLDGLHKPVMPVDIPDPHIGQRQLEIEVVAG